MRHLEKDWSEAVRSVPTEELISVRCCVSICTFVLVKQVNRLPASAAPLGDLERLEGNRQPLERHAAVARAEEQRLLLQPLYSVQYVHINFISWHNMRGVNIACITCVYIPQRRGYATGETVARSRRRRTCRPLTAPALEIYLRLILHLQLILYTFYNLYNKQRDC
jgi:hypothetical protein